MQKILQGLLDSPWCKQLVMVPLPLVDKMLVRKSKVKLAFCQP